MVFFSRSKNSDIESSEIIVIYERQFWYFLLISMSTTWNRNAKIWREIEHDLLLPHATW